MEQRFRKGGEPYIREIYDHSPALYLARDVAVPEHKVDQEIREVYYLLKLRLYESISIELMVP